MTKDRAGREPGTPRRQTPKGVASRRRTQAPDAGQTDAVLDAIGATEDPGDFSLGQALTALGTLFDRRRASREAVLFGGELLKILRGESEIRIHPKDPRFKDPAWTGHPVFRRLGQAYMAFCKAVEKAQPDHPEWRERERARFASDILTSMLAPTNLLFTNPAALKHARETRGTSLIKGARNFLHDLRHNGGMPSQVDRSGFEVGRNLAVTPGAVVFRNEILEILQYQPTTPQVCRRPLLIISPQVNKFYFLDLAPGRSFVEYAVSQGIQTFIVSWRNPDASQGHWDLDAYCQALLDAMDAVRTIAGTPDLNTFGFCAGGMTMSVVLAHLAAIGDTRVHAACYAVTLLDFSVPALIGALNSRPLLRKALERSRQKKVYPGKDLAKVFAWFRPNDLVWNYWVNNYLMGKQPPAFDILAWNADSSNLPAALHEDFLEIFRDNPLPRPGAWKALGSAVDLSKIKIDTFLTGAVTDHLTPWKACYQTTQLLGGKCTFVLSNAGHIASLINPPGGSKSSYWTGPRPLAGADEWLETAKQHQGSWWECWKDWVIARSGEAVPAPKLLGSKRHPALDAAPGTYIL